MMSRPLSCPRLIGRSEELAALRSAVAAAGGGAGGFVVVEGEAGIGKTRLVETFAEAAAGEGARVLRGSCLPLAEDLPYAPMLEILHRLGEDRAPTGLGERHRFFRYVADTLTGDRVPTVAVVEDLHWADTSTRDLLVFLARALREATVLLVGTVRSDEPSPDAPLPSMLTELYRSGRALRLRLRPLLPGEVAEQLAGILGSAPTTALARRLYERAEGNPFFVEEILAAGPQGEAVPPTVSEMILARLAGLSRSAQQVAAAAAVIGRSMDHALLATVCALPVGKLEAGLREAMSRQLVVTTEEGYAFRHALIREAVYSALLPGERTRLHERAAAALSAVPAAEVAHHWDAAGRPREALEASMRAGAAAEALAAPAEAFTHYERVLRLWPRVPGAEEIAGLGRSALLTRTAQVASLAGHDGRAGDLAAEALDAVDRAVDPVQAAALLERLGRYRWLAGSLAAAWSAYDEAGRLVQGGPASAASAKVLAALAQSMMLRARTDDAIGYAREAIATARDVDCAAAEGHASNTLGTCLCGLGRLDEGLSLLRGAVRIALDLDDAAEIERGYNNLVECLTLAGRHVEALAATEEAIAQLRRCGIAPAYEPEFHAYAARALLRLGRWDEAGDAARAALAGLEDAPSGGALVVFVYPDVLSLEIRRGRLTSAAAMLDRLAGSVREAGSELFTAELARLTAELALAGHRFEQARAAVREGLGGRGEALHSTTTKLALCALGAQAEADAHTAAIITGHRADRAAAVAEAAWLAERAEAIVGEITEQGGTAGADQLGYRLLAQAELSRLGAEADPGIWTRFAADRTEAADPYLTAYGLFRQAEAVLLGRGARSKAAPALRQAYGEARRLGAMPLLGQIEDLAQRAGIEPAEQPVPEPTGPFKDLGLTRREREVMALLGEGLSNGQIAQALFISTKTASVHVSAILRKLGVTTRVQASAIARQLAGPSPASGKGPDDAATV